MLGVVVGVIGIFQFGAAILGKLLSIGSSTLKKIDSRLLEAGNAEYTKRHWQHAQELDYNSIAEWSQGAKNFISKAFRGIAEGSNQYRVFSDPLRNKGTDIIVVDVQEKLIAIWDASGANRIRTFFRLSPSLWGSVEEFVASKGGWIELSYQELLEFLKSLNVF